MRPPPPPPLSPALEQALARLRPARTRRPVRAFAGVVGVSLLHAGLVVWRLGLRQDLAALARFPFTLYAAGCLATFLALLWCALVPPRGAVVPSGSASARVTALMLGALVSLDLAMAFYPPAHDVAAGLSPSLSGMLGDGGRCLLTSVEIVALPIAFGLWSLRHLWPLGGWRVLLALGGATGALSGLVLHTHCSVSDLAHVGVFHASALVLPALILAFATRDRLSVNRNRDMSDEEPRNGS